MAKTAVAVSGGEVRRGSWLERTKDFYGDVRAELKKVSTPSRKEVQATTVVVIITVFIFAAFFWVTDAVIQFGLDRLLRFFK